MNLTVNGNTKRGLSREQKDRLNKAVTKVSAKDKRRRQVLQQQRKKTKKCKAYIPGGFSTSVVTDNIENTRSYYEHETLEINRNHTDTEVLILFINDSSIPMIINQFQTVFLFYTPFKHQKTYSLSNVFRGIKRKHGVKMG